MGQSVLDKSMGRTTEHLGFNLNTEVDMESDGEEELIADLIQDKIGIPDDALDI